MWYRKTLYSLCLWEFVYVQKQPDPYSKPSLISLIKAESQIRLHPRDSMVLKSTVGHYDSKTEEAARRFDEYRALPVTLIFLHPHVSCDFLSSSFSREEPQYMY